MTRLKINTSHITPKFIIQVALALIPIAMSVYFLKHGKGELSQSFALIRNSSLLWVAIGLVFTVAYLLVHACMYQASFATVNAKATFSSLFLLALKRSFISVFLPAGGVASLAFFTAPIERQHISKTRIHLASTIYGIAGFASLIVVAIPAMIMLFLSHSLSNNVLFAFVLLIIFVVMLSISFVSFVKGGVLFRLASRFLPSVVVLYKELEDQKYSTKQLVMTVFFSILIEVCGVAHLYIAAQALGIDVSFKVALFGYVVATLMYAISPFMRGLGAVEISLTLVLVKFGVPSVGAISISLLYRIFEFWLPLFAGACSFFFRKDGLLLRIFPAFFTLMLGLVNIFSVMTPALADRMKLLNDFIPDDAVYFTNFAVIVAGVILIILSAYLIRGLRNAWIATMIISCLSVFGHVAKALDVGEALFGIFVISLLLYTRKNYKVKSNRQLFHNMKYYLVGTVAFILVYGILGFYIMDKRHFGIDFDLKQSLVYLGNALIMVNNADLEPKTRFAGWFLHSLNFLGFSLIVTSLYTLLKPLKHDVKTHADLLEKAKVIVEKYGRTDMDYFKLYKDKMIYISKDGEAFVSFRIAGDYAVVLEIPVCKSDDLLVSVIREFDLYCASNGLKTMYYRVDEKHLPCFQPFKRKELFIGQVGIVDVQKFTLEGGVMKPLRNAINKAANMGYICKTYHPPLKEGLIQKLKAVSSEWLQSFEKKETAFTQGIWDSKEIKQQVVMTIEDPEEKVVAFANIIPDYAPNEGTYDMIRKTKDANGGALDVLMVNMINYFKSQNIQYLNLGMAPLSGIENAKNFNEKTIKFAYENLKQLDHFKGLRFFKEKYAFEWHNKYLVYSNNFDLLQAPVVISKVGKFEEMS